MNKIKILSYYFLEFILTFLVFFTFILFFFKVSILNPNYIIKKLNENHYYEDLAKNIESTMEDYLRPSGLPMEVVKDIYTESDLKREVDGMINNLYSGKKVNVETKNIQDKLNSNIKTYLEKNNIKVSDEDSLDKFTDEVIKIYKKRIIISEELESISPSVNKWNKRINLASIILAILSIVLAFIIRFSFKKKALIIPFITSSIMMMIVNNIMFLRIDIEHILFWNKSITLIIKKIFYDLSSNLKNISIILLVVTILILIITSLLKKYKKKLSF